MVKKVERKLDFIALGRRNGRNQEKPPDYVSLLGKDPNEPTCANFGIHVHEEASAHRSASAREAYDASFKARPTDSLANSGASSRTGGPPPARVVDSVVQERGEARRREAVDRSAEAAETPHTSADLAKTAKTPHVCADLAEAAKTPHTSVDFCEGPKDASCVRGSRRGRDDASY